MRALVAAGFFALAVPAGAACPESDTYFSPAWNGPFKTYGIPTAFLDPTEGGKSVTGKTGKVCAGCESPARGVVLTSKREFGGGYFQLPFEVGATFCARALVDVTKVSGAGAFVSFEFDSPAVAVDAAPETFVWVGVEDLLGVRTVHALVDGAPVGTPLELAPETPGVVLEMEYAAGAVDVRATPVSLGEPQGLSTTTIVDGAVFAFSGAGALGAGAFNLAKGDRAGITIVANGELFTAALRDVLADLTSIWFSANGAQLDLADELPADARAKIEEALAALDPGVLAAVGALPESAPKTYAVAQLAKAGPRLLAARDAIDAATPASLKSALAGVRKAAVALDRVRRVLATGSTAEAKAPQE